MQFPYSFIFRDYVKVRVVSPYDSTDTTKAS